jgi:hypothetical protein
MFTVLFLYAIPSPVTGAGYGDISTKDFWIINKRFLAENDILIACIILSRKR